MSKRCTLPRPNRSSLKHNVSSVLPTPVGPRNRKLALGRPGLVNPNSARWRTAGNAGNDFGLSANAGGKVGGQTGEEIFGSLVGSHVRREKQLVYGWMNFLAREPQCSQKWRPCQSTLLFPYIKTAATTFYTASAPKLGVGLLNLRVRARAGGRHRLRLRGLPARLSTVMKIGFLLGVVVIAGGGMAIRGGRAEEGKMAIVGGLIIAGAPAILKALFTAFGLSGSSVSVGQ